MAKNRRVRRSRAAEDLEEDRAFQKVLREAKRGTDISHLIPLEPKRQTRPQHSRQSPRRYGRPTSSGTHLHLEGKQYINAHYRFILDPSGDYKSQLLDPSYPPEERDIIRVLVNNGDYHCPICLGDEFVAPRMTRCGHIFCLPCILSFFEFADPKLKSISCPLCSNVIKQTHPLLPVLIDPRPAIVKSPVESNSKISMTLMYKPHGSINAIPMINYLSNGGKIFTKLAKLDPEVNSLNWFKNDVCQFNRLILSNDLFTLDCLQHDKQLLQTQRMIDMEAYSSDPKWFDKSIELIDASINQHTCDSLPGKLAQLNINDNSPNEITSWPPESDSFYYYQYELPNTKQSYILSNLDSRIVRHFYLGSAQAEITPSNYLPLKLDVTVESINGEFTQITPDTLTKFKYLGHYPMGKEICVLNINWPNSVPDSNLTLNDELKKKISIRSRNYKDKVKFEEKERIKGEKIREEEVNRVFHEQEHNDENLSYDIVTKKMSKPNKVLEEWQQQQQVPSTANPGMESKKFSKTVWGTHIPIVVNKEQEALMIEEERLARLEVENAIKRANEEQGKKKGKNKKKIYLNL